MSSVGNWVGELTTTVGIGSISLGGALTGFTTFQSIGETFFWYAIIDGNNREAGEGTYVGGILTRDTVYSTLVNGVYSDNSPAPISLSGVSEVFATFNKTAFDEFTDTTDQFNVHVINSDIHFPDAPVDSTPYVRQDDSWIPLPIYTARKNFLLNGDFGIWQRGDGPYNTSIYNADRWFGAIIAPDFIVRNQDLNLPELGRVSCVLFSRGVGGGAPAIRQYIENGMKQMVGQDIVFSVWAYEPDGGCLGTITIAEYNGTTIQNEQAISLFGIRTSGVFTLYTGTITVGDVFTPGYDHLRFSMGNTLENHDLILTGAQIELGTLLTNFERVIVSEEIQLCRRYYQNWGRGIFGFSGFLAPLAAARAAGGSVSAGLPLSVLMREDPTVVATGDFSILDGDSDLNGTFDQSDGMVGASLSLRFDTILGPAISTPIVVFPNANSGLELDAEL